MFHLSVYVPEKDLESVKEALFNAGAGSLGHYDRCAWQTEGWGQFRPLPGSEPAIGELSQDSRVRETKLEMLCAEERLPAALAALREAHPYEEPAFTVIRPELPR